MRYESSVTSLSWIPSEAVEGTTRVPFEMGVAHYDPPPPDELKSLDALRKADRFRFANNLSAWIEVDNGNIVDAGYSGGGQIGSTTVRVGGLSHVFQAVALPDIQRAPEYGDNWVRFSQTAGGRTGVPAPRTVRRAPFIQWQAPLAWTTLTLTLHTKGTADFEMTGASRFPRHWVYDHAGKLASKSGLIDFQDWYRKSFGRHSPWGEQESEAFVTIVETALERSLSRQLMSGAAKPKIMKIDAGTSIVRQGEKGSYVYLILDGVARIEVDGKRLAEYGPGALLGERAYLEGGERTSSIIAVTACRVASVPAEALDRGSLEQLSTGHRREDTSAG
jgi:Cyclic nucleotide-binding domain